MRVYWKARGYEGAGLLARSGRYGAAGTVRWRAQVCAAVRRRPGEARVGFYGRGSFRAFAFAGFVYPPGFGGRGLWFGAYYRPDRIRR